MSSEVGAGVWGISGVGRSSREGAAVEEERLGHLQARLRTLHFVLDSCLLPLPSQFLVVSDEGDLPANFLSCSISLRSS